MKRMLTETEKVEIIEHEWAKAREIRHLPSCCRGGEVLDPPLPRVRTDAKDSGKRAS